MRLALAFAASLTVGACATPPPVMVDSLDLAAHDYVALQLAIGEKENGYIDAYYGPPELKVRGQAIAAAANLESLSSDVDTLSARIGALSARSTPELRRRAQFLLAQLVAAGTRLRMLSGEKLSFAEEARGLFGVRPEFKPLSSYDPVLARLETLVPGEGPLWQRVDAFQDRFIIPKARLRSVMDAAIAECRARTLRYIPLPPGERFDLGFVTGKSWGGYNYYQGNYHSRIEVNTDLPSRMASAVDLGCHEGYPGHHVLNALLEQRLTRGRGWVEFSVYPLYSPQSLIAEGSANYGADLAFPGPEKAAFEVGTLYPLAGMPTAEAARYGQLREALKEIGNASMAIQADLLDGRITEPQAVAMLQKYGLQSEARARKGIAFARQYRSYVINYGLGQDMVRADVESHSSPAGRWKRFEEIISEPTLPSDLMPTAAR